MVLPLRNYNMNLSVEWVEIKGQYLKLPWSNSSCFVKPSGFAHFAPSCFCNQQCFKSQSRATPKTTAKSSNCHQRKIKPTLNEIEFIRIIKVILHVSSNLIYLSTYLRKAGERSVWKGYSVVTGLKINMCLTSCLHQALYCGQAGKVKTISWSCLRRSFFFPYGHFSWSIQGYIFKDKCFLIIWTLCIQTLWRWHLSYEPPPRPSNYWAI